MIQASGSNAILKASIEQIEGTQDNTAKNFVLGFKSGESLTATVNTYTSEQITSVRGAADTRNGSINVSGGTSHELTFNNLAIFAYASLGSVEQNNEDGKFKKVFKRAKTLPSFSIEKSFTDINDYYLFTGLKANTFSIENGIDSLIQTSIDWIGKEVKNKSTAHLEAENEVKITHPALLADIDTTIEIDGLKACTNSFSLSIENNLEKINCIGSQFGNGVAVGRGKASGEVAVSYNSNAFFNKIKNDTISTLKITYEKDGNKAILEFPKVKFNGDMISKIDTESAIFTSFGFTALIDELKGSDVIITIIDDFDLTNIFPNI